MLEHAGDTRSMVSRKAGCSGSNAQKSPSVSTPLPFADVPRWFPSAVLPPREGPRDARGGHRSAARVWTTLGVARLRVSALEQRRLRHEAPNPPTL